jgi:hypothetical protein
MCVHVYIYTHTHIHTRVYISIRVCVCVSVCTICNEQTAAARVLRARGVERGSVVATCVAEGHCAIVTQLAILLAGTCECYKYHEMFPMSLLERETWRHGAAGQEREKERESESERERTRETEKHPDLAGGGGQEEPLYPLTPASLPTAFRMFYTTPRSRAAPAAARHPTCYLSRLPTSFEYMQHISCADYR